MSGGSQLLLGAGEAAAELGNSTDLDGTEDNLSFSGQMTGTTDSKDMTFSFWIYINDTTDGHIINSSVNVFWDVSLSRIVVEGHTSGGSKVLDVKINNLPIKTFIWGMVSVGMASTGTRGVVINDEVWTDLTWTTYTIDGLIEVGGVQGSNDFIIGGQSFGAPTVASHFKGRESDIFLDAVFRNPATESERRKFSVIDSEKGLIPIDSSGLSALSPIMTALTDQDDRTINLNGVDSWTENGVMARSNRGPNQYNAVSSELDGSTQWIRTSSIGASDGKQCFLSFEVLGRNVVGSLNQSVFHIGNGTATRSCEISLKANRLDLYFADAAGTQSVFIRNVGVVDDRNYSFQVSFDTSDQNTLAVIQDGEDITSSLTVSTYIDTALAFNKSDYLVAARAFNGNPAGYDGNLGNFIFDTSLVDLLADNPAYDVETNKPKFVPDGTYLIQTDMRGDQPGVNRGASGAFAVSGGPTFTGARGGSEFFARSIAVDGTNFLSKAGGIFCQSLVKWKSVDSGVTWVVTYANAVTVTNIGNGTDNGQVAYYFGTSENINWGLEENTLRFTDAFDFPIPPEIDGSTVLFLDFEDDTNFGFNKGTDGNYTITGSPSQTGDVNG